VDPSSAARLRAAKANQVAGTTKEKTPAVVGKPQPSNAGIGLAAALAREKEQEDRANRAALKKLSGAAGGKNKARRLPTQSATCALPSLANAHVNGLAARCARLKPH